MIKKKILYTLLLLFLIGDFTYSFLQFYYTPLDGDLASEIIPASDVQEIFNDPFGFSTIVNNKPHLNPNRYFSHLALKNYFSYTPIFLQKFISPIESIYISVSILKLVIQIMMIYLIGVVISNVKSIFSTKLLGAMIIITPLFQTYGYNRYMGIIDQAISYNFFYALPLLTLMFFIHPFITNEKLNIFKKFILLILVIVMPFSGPLIPPIILIISILLICNYYKKIIQGGKMKIIKTLHQASKNIPNHIFLFIVPLGILCLYSLFLGTYNSNFQEDSISLFERYLRLPSGIYYILTQKPGYLLLFSLLILNIFLIMRYFKQINSIIILRNLKWIAVFSLIYLVLLPLGGYRGYRENIIRYDTFMPITICLIYAYGATSYYLINNIKKNKKLYWGIIAAFIIMFTNADISGLNENDCEKKSLLLISNSTSKIINLNNNCSVMSWETTKEYEWSKLNSELLLLWNITDEKKSIYLERFSQYKK